MKNFTFIVLILISTSQSFAQVDNYRADLDFLFGALNKTKATTGYLAPYGIDAIDKDDFNGILADSNTVNSLDLFRFIYADIFTAKFNPAAISLPTVETLNQNLQAANPNSLAIFYANYNEFREDALQQNLLRYVNGRLYDPPLSESKNGQNIIIPGAYTSKKLFAVSPVTQAYTNTVTFRYNPALFLNNTAATVQNIWINFGNGYTSMAANTDYGNTYTDSTGYHRIAIKAQMSNGDIVETYTAVMVEVTNQPNAYTPADLANPDFIISSDANQSGCKVYIRRSVNTPTSQILRPFIVAEGLDIHDGAPAIDKTNYNVNDLIREWEKVRFNGTTVNFNFDDIGHYDLIFIDWNNGVDDIRRNALTMEMVINTINSMKTGTEQNVVMGISMGGLVARYTLASMTKRGLPAQTRLLITHDSPHQGAYVPLAFQHMVTGLQNKTILGVRIGAIGSFIDQGVQLLSKPAAQQQLMMTSADENGTIHYNSFLNDIYRPMVKFEVTDPIPQYQFIATSMGSQCGIGTMPVGGNLAYGEAQGSIGGPLFILTAGIFSRFRLKISLNAKGLKADGQPNEILYFRWRRESSMFFGAVNTSKTFIELHRNEPTGLANPIPWESVPAGVENLRFTDQTIFAGGWSIFSLGFFGYDARFQLGNQFSFVPVISALDIVNPAGINRNNIFNFVANVTTPAGTFIPQKIIAQERFFGSSGFEFNQPHTDFTSRNALFIFNEMQNIAQQITCDDICTPEPNTFQIEGPDVLCISEVYTVTNVPVTAMVTWPVSAYYTITPLNANSSQVLVTVAAPGQAYLNAQVNFSGACISYSTPVSKQLKIGSPAAYTYVPHFSTGGNNGYLQDVNHLMTYQFPGFYSGDIHIVDNIANQYTWAKISQTGTSTATISGSTDGKDVTATIKPQCGSAIFRMTATNTCGSYSHDYKFIADNVICFTNPTGIETVSSSEIDIFPNPGSGQFSISLNTTGKNAGIREIIIKNKMGTPVYHQKFSNNQKQQTINLSANPTDIYIVEIFDGTQWTTKKLILQR